jgi:hemerythrin-like domain-containing protein
MIRITEILVIEHAAFTSAFGQIQEALQNAQTLREIKQFSALVKGLLQQHVDTERNLAYLALDHVLEDQGQLHRLHQEHEEIDDHLSRVDAATDLSEGRRLFRMALQAAREHFRHEEQVVFPLIERMLRPETLKQLADVWLHRYSAPTRTSRKTARLERVEAP